MHSFRLLVLTVFLISSSLLSAETFKMAYNQSWEPYSWGEGNQVQGLLVDKIDQYFSELGVEIEHIGVPWNRVQTGVETGKYDGFVSVPTKTRLAYSNSSRNIVFTIEMKPVVASITEDTLALDSPESLQNYRVCDIFGNGWARNFYKKLRIDVFEAPTVDNCLKMIAIGRMDVIVQPYDVTDSKIKNLALEDELTILPLVFGKMEFTLLTSKKSSFQQEFIEKFDEIIFTAK